MKKLFLFVLSVFVTFSLVSCVTTVSAQDDLYETRDAVETNSYNNAEIELVITYGTPYIIDGLVQYYIYNGLYYYPFYYRDYFYWRIYRAPLLSYPRYWRPVPRAYWFRGGRFYRPNRFDRHYHNGVIRGYRHHHNDGYNGRGNGVNHRPSIGNRRPSSTRTTVPSNVRPRVQNRNGNFNGGRFSSPQVRPNGNMRSIGSSPRIQAPSRSNSGGRFGGRR